MNLTYILVQKLLATKNKVFKVLNFIFKHFLDLSFDLMNEDITPLCQQVGANTITHSTVLVLLFIAFKIGHRAIMRLTYTPHNTITNYTPRIHNKNLNTSFYSKSMVIIQYQEPKTNLIPYNKTLALTPSTPNLHKKTCMKFHNKYLSTTSKKTLTTQNTPNILVKIENPKTKLKIDVKYLVQIIKKILWNAFLILIIVVSISASIYNLSEKLENASEDEFITTISSNDKTNFTYNEDFNNCYSDAQSTSFVKKIKQEWFSFLDLFSKDRKDTNTVFIYNTDLTTKRLDTNEQEVSGGVLRSITFTKRESINKDMEILEDIHTQVVANNEALRKIISSRTSK
jgi:hypothetical protein